MPKVNPSSAELPSWIAGSMSLLSVWFLVSSCMIMFVFNFLNIVGYDYFPLIDKFQFLVFVGFVSSVAFVLMKMPYIMVTMLLAVAEQIPVLQTNRRRIVRLKCFLTSSTFLNRLIGVLCLATVALVICRLTMDLWMGEPSEDKRLALTALLGISIWICSLVSFLLLAVTLLAQNERPPGFTISGASLMLILVSSELGTLWALGIKNADRNLEMQLRIENGQLDSTRAKIVMQAKQGILVYLAGDDTVTYLPFSSISRMSRIVDE